MIADIKINDLTFKSDLSKPIDISIEVGVNNHPPTAWYVPPIKIKPVVNEMFTGSVKLGGSVNFNDIYFNPHGHCTHTESVGHITPELVSVNEVLKEFFFLAQVISVEPQPIENGDLIIDVSAFKSKIQKSTQAVVIRTLPNSEKKLHKQYSNTNWPYLTKEAAIYLRENEIDHLLIDLPSVDREEDGGELAAHRAFWNYPLKTRMHATITEMVYVPDNVEDGTFLLNLQIASFINDASPSKPVLYRII